MNNWKDLIRKEDRERLMTIYRNLNWELTSAAKELQKHGHDIENSEGYVKLMTMIQENWEQLRDSGEFGFGNRGTNIDG